LKIYKKTSIEIVCSRWDELFGRISLEVSANGCAVIISNKGGLPETITNGIILKKLNSTNLYNEIDAVIKNHKFRGEVKKKSYENFYLRHSHVTRLLDKLRGEILF
jgi:Glycosyltransferase